MNTKKSRRPFYQTLWEHNVRHGNFLLLEGRNEWHWGQGWQCNRCAVIKDNARDYSISSDSPSARLKGIIGTTVVLVGLYTVWTIGHWVYSFMHWMAFGF